MRKNRVADILPIFKGTMPRVCYLSLDQLHAKLRDVSVSENTVIWKILFKKINIKLSMKEAYFFICSTNYFSEIQPKTYGAMMAHESFSHGHRFQSTLNRVKQIYYTLCTL